MVLTVARLGARPGFTKISERRSESSIVTNWTARSRIGSISSAQRHKYGIARCVARSCLTSSCSTSVDVAQNGNIFFADTSSYSALSAVSRLGSRVTVLADEEDIAELRYGRALALVANASTDGSPVKLVPSHPTWPRWTGFWQRFGHRLRSPAARCFRLLWHGTSRIGGIFSAGLIALHLFLEGHSLT